MRKKPLTKCEFLQIIAETQAAGLGYDELVRRTGMTRGSIAARIFKLRAEGVVIVSFQREYTKQSPEELNAYYKKALADAKKKQKPKPKK